jgi:hypothetical protein
MGDSTLRLARNIDAGYPDEPADLLIVEGDRFRAVWFLSTLEQHPGHLEGRW